MKTQESFMKKFFAKNTQASAFGEPTKTVERLTELMSSGSVLDLGAGDGRHALYLAKKGFQVHAIDVSPSGIEKMQRLASERELDLQTEIVDVSTYQVDRDYDAIIIVLLLQCLDEAASLRLMDDVQIHTKSGGINVVHLFTKTGDRPLLDHQEDPQAFYPEDGWLKKCYQEWEIIEHTSSSSPLIGKFHEDGSSMTSVIEWIVARKP